MKNCYTLVKRAAGGAAMKSFEHKVASISDYYVFSPSKTAQEMFLYPLQCGLFTYDPGYTLKRNSFDSFLLMYIQRGTMLLDLNGKQQQVKDKHFVLIDCYQPHGYSTREGYECLWMHFDGVLARGYYDLIVSRLKNVFAMEDAFPVLRKMNTILKTFQENKQLREPLLSKYITDILTEFMLYNPGAGSAGNSVEALERAMIYISEHFTEEIPVSRIAAVAGMSEYHFIRVFRQETGYTPHEYIVNRRMASARYLLKYTELTVKEICFNTGFSSESVFCNAFKKQHRMTPQQYRLHGI